MPNILNVGITGTEPSLLGRVDSVLSAYPDSYVAELVLGPSGRVELEGWDRVTHTLPVSIVGGASFNLSGASFSVSGSLPLGGSPTAGQQAATTSAAVLSANTASKIVVLQADPNNTPDILVGTASGQFIRLIPGGVLVLEVTNTNLIYCKTSTGTGSVNWMSIN